MKIPKFDELPIRKDLPAESSWGVFGDNDALGCLNFLTPERVVDAAKLVQSGKVFRLDAAHRIRHAAFIRPRRSGAHCRSAGTDGQ